MRKIISLFQRNYDGDRLVRNELVPGAEWVIEGDGHPTRKYDGTACLVRDGKLYRRYDAKHGKQPPAGWEPCEPEPDAVTGHWPGWLPVGDGPGDRWHRAAWAACAASGLPVDWTYELCGPHFQGNPERFERDVFITHGNAILHECPRDFDGIKAYLCAHDIESIVWWRDLQDQDCEQVKIKTRDFGYRRGLLV